VASLVILGLVGAAAIFAPLLSPADPIKNDLLERLTPPMWSAGGSAAHPLGTDTLGRDVLAVSSTARGYRWSSASSP